MFQIVNNSAKMNCSMLPFKIEPFFGEHPGVCLTLAILLILGSFLSWVLHTFKNSFPAHNVFLNIRVVENMTAIMFTTVRKYSHGKIILKFLTSHLTTSKLFCCSVCSANVSVIPSAFVFLWSSSICSFSFRLSDFFSYMRCPL